MVVVSVMSVLTLGVVLGFGGAQSLSPSARASDPARQAQALEQAFEQARDLALFTRQPVGLHPLRQGWQILRRDASGGWIPEPHLTAHLEKLVLDWQINARPYAAPELAEVERPAIVILGDGRSTPFALRISSRQGTGTPHLCTNAGGQPMRCNPV